MLLSGETLSEVELDTPKGDHPYAASTILPGAKPMSPVRYRRMQGMIGYHQRDPGLCKAEKFSISAAEQAGQQKTEKSRPQIILDGGIGVGRVDKPGLSQNVGEAAINPVPRALILQEARRGGPGI